MTHDHDHHHPRPASAVELRARALELLLAERGLVSTDAIDAVVELYEQDVGPQNGAKVVARAWVDERYRERLLTAANEAIAELGFGGAEGDNMVVVANTPAVHNVIVCTLCSCYPWPVLGLPPSWYKSPPYRARAVAEPRAVLRESGWSWVTRSRSGCGTRAPRSATWCSRCVRRRPRAGARRSSQRSSRATA
jgi:nitrile hydratase